MLFKKVGDTCLNGGFLAGTNISIFLIELENGVVAVRKMTKPNAPTSLSNKYVNLQNMRNVEALQFFQ
jgi:hypothetical protein